jgi:importin-7
MRLARESIALEESAGEQTDIDRLMEQDGGEDKIFAAMGVAKTIGTVRICRLRQISSTEFVPKVVSSVDSSPEILAQVQEIIIPVIVLTLENKLLGQSLSTTCKLHLLICFINRSL